MRGRPPLDPALKLERRRIVLERLAAGQRLKQIAFDFGCTVTTISLIAKGKR